MSDVFPTVTDNIEYVNKIYSFALQSQDYFGPCNICKSILML